MNDHPSVTVAIPVLDEEPTIGRCLAAVSAQTYGRIVETLVIDGGSRDATREVAAAWPGVRLLHNPGRRQAHALNLALKEAKGHVLVRVDAHAFIAADYVERCIDALARTGAAMVGGQVWPERSGWLGGGIAAAMRSPFGAGPARFRSGGPPGWADTVAFGAYHVDTARAVGGYSTDDVSEDSEFAYRMSGQGGVWFDPAISSTYVPRADLRRLAAQYHRYGGMRARTLRRHPASVRPRQLAGPLLVLGLLSPLRRQVVVAYAGVLAVAAYRERRRPRVIPGLLLAVPVMHLTWGMGFLTGLARRSRGRLSERRRAC
jgi:glycosyltransferase involved in cell wall biosynthesis